MTQWGNTDDAANSVSWAAASLGQGSGKAAQLANNTAFYNNVSVGVWKNNNTAIHNTMGQFGVSRAEMANTTGESGKVTHPGWQIRRHSYAQSHPYLFWVVLELLYPLPPLFSKDVFFQIQDRP